jgi:hypothetical protein
MGNDRAFEWSDKLLAVGVALAGSFTAVTIALSTFAVQKESEEAKSRRDLLAERNLHQDVLDAVEDLFRTADDKLSQISTLTFSGEKEIEMLTTDFWRTVREKQDVFWSAIDRASRTTSGYPSLTEVWKAHFSVRGFLRRGERKSVVENLLRQTGLFAVKVTEKSPLPLNEIIQNLRSARADGNFDSLLWCHLARALPKRFDLLKGRVETGSNTEVGPERTTEDGDGLSYFDGHSSPEDKSCTLTVPKDVLRELFPDEAKIIDHRNETVKYHMDSMPDLWGDIFSNIAQIRERIREMAELDPDGIEPEDMDTTEKSVADFFESVEAIVSDSQDGLAFYQRIQDKVDSLARLPLPGTTDLLRNRHDRKFDAWLAQLHTEIAGLLLVPDMMAMGYVKTEKGDLKTQKIYVINLGLAFLHDICEVYTSDTSVALFGKSGGGRKNQKISDFSLGYFTKSYLKDIEIVQRSIVQSFSVEKSSFVQDSKIILKTNSNIPLNIPEFKGGEVGAVGLNAQFPDILEGLQSSWAEKESELKASTDGCRRASSELKATRIKLSDAERQVKRYKGLAVSLENESYRHVLKKVRDLNLDLSNLEYEKEEFRALLDDQKILSKAHASRLRLLKKKILDIDSFSGSLIEDLAAIGKYKGSDFVVGSARLAKTSNRNRALHLKERLSVSLLRGVIEASNIADANESSEENWYEVVKAIGSCEREYLSFCKEVHEIALNLGI